MSHIQCSRGMESEGCAGVRDGLKKGEGGSPAPVMAFTVMTIRVPGSDRTQSDPLRPMFAIRFLPHQSGSRQDA